MKIDGCAKDRKETREKRAVNEKSEREKMNKYYD
jgi:hypothetical protein